MIRAQAKLRHSKSSLLVTNVEFTSIPAHDKLKHYKESPLSSIPAAPCLTSPAASYLTIHQGGLITQLKGSLLGDFTLC
jgi:hypothetical protein